MALQVGDRSDPDGFTALFGEGSMGRFYQQLVNRDFQSISSRIFDLVVTETHSVLPERNIFNAQTDHPFIFRLSDSDVAGGAIKPCSCSE